MTGYTDAYTEKMARGEELTAEEYEAHEAQLAHKKLGEEKLLRQLDALAQAAKQATAIRTGLIG